MTGTDTEPRSRDGPPDSNTPERDGRRALPRADRAVSVTVNYTLNLAIATILISGLLFAVGNTVEDRREEAIRSELEVVGQRLAANLQSADRLARAGGADSRVRIETPLPDTVATIRYSVAAGSDASGEEFVRLSTDDPQVEVTVTLRTEVFVSFNEFPSGDAVVVFDGTTLEVVRG